MASCILETFQEHAELNTEERRLWDTAVQAIPASRNLDSRRLDNLLKTVTFDPGKMTHLKALGPAGYQTLLAGCPGVPAGRLKITSVTAANIARKRGTPSFQTVLNSPAFAHLAGSNPGMPLQNAIDLAVEKGDGSGLNHRQMEPHEWLEAFVQTTHLSLKNPMDIWNYPRNLSDDLLAAFALRLIRCPSVRGLEFLGVHGTNLPLQLRAAATMLAHQWLPMNGQAMLLYYLDREALTELAISVAESTVTPGSLTPGSLTPETVTPGGAC